MNSDLQVDAANFRFKAVYNAVLNGIEHGEWHEHDKLPSVRLMAERMQLHRLTVFKAYQLLKQDNIVYVKEKAGYFVSPVMEHSTDEAPEASWNYRAQAVYVNRSRLSEIHQIPVQYPMSEALINPNLLPNVYMSDYVKKVFDLYPKVLGTYSSVQGDPELREALAGYFIEKYRIEVSPEDLLITSGAQQAIDLISRALLRPGDAVMIERPTYSAAIDIFRQQNIRLLPVDIHPDGYDLEQIEGWMKRAKPRLFYMNPTFHNPTGFTVPSWQRKQLVELAERYKCMLVEDDVFHDMYFEEPPPSPIFSYDTEGYVIYISSFSKYIAPGLRVAVLAARPSIMKSLMPVKALLDNGSPLLNQKIFLHYFFSSRLQEHVAKLRIALQIRKEKMEKILSASNWSWTSPKGGLSLWIQLPKRISVDILLERCLQQSIAFVPGNICDPLGQLDDWIRLNYSYIHEGLIEEGVQKLIIIADSLNQ
jgi:GntR family transcriptional regulator, regulator for abcA and norABC